MLTPGIGLRRAVVALFAALTLALAALPATAEQPGPAPPAADGSQLPAATGTPAPPAEPKLQNIEKPAGAIEGEGEAPPSSGCPYREKGKLQHIV